MSEGEPVPETEEEAAEAEEERDRFADMNRVGWHAYVWEIYTAYGRPSYNTIRAKAKECDSSCTLGRSTVSDTLRAVSWPTAQTAKWIGAGIGGKSLGSAFFRAQQAAERNHRREAQEAAVQRARRVQEARREAESVRLDDEDSRPLWRLLPGFRRPLPYGTRIWSWVFVTVVTVVPVAYAVWQMIRIMS
ncbi:hypothetical protein [Streptomyces acidiscabies]|uniref:Uncharacterized protein n=1 Tax=Streptomyces acidiscabies TaxID=42234 RepID=A0ABU4MB90_9ACTN|nr:hypothetical protein [Streptomyces acidiscabies]MDX3025391.1 hypothetical protein [Streptomyces acidiscabies]